MKPFETDNVQPIMKLKSFTEQIREKLFKNVDIGENEYNNMMFYYAGKCLDQEHKELINCKKFWKQFTTAYSEVDLSFIESKESSTKDYIEFHRLNDCSYIDNMTKNTLMIEYKHELKKQNERDIFDELMGLAKEVTSGR